jgi:hypothetical protein
MTPPGPIRIRTKSRIGAPGVALCLIFLFTVATAAALVLRALFNLDWSI